MKLPRLTHRVSVYFFGGAESSEAEKKALIRPVYTLIFLRRGIKLFAGVFLLGIVFFAYPKNASAMVPTATLSWLTGAGNEFEIWAGATANDNASLAWDNGTLVCQATLTDTNTNTVSCASGTINPKQTYRIQAVLKNPNLSPAYGMQGAVDWVDQVQAIGSTQWAGSDATIGMCGFNDINSDDTGSPVCNAAVDSTNNVRITNTGGGSNVVLNVSTGLEGFMYLVTTSGITNTSSASYMNTTIDTVSNSKSSKITFTASTPSATVSSAASQEYNIGQTATAIPTITISDFNGRITAANDIRLKIDTSAAHMLWDTSDTTAVFGGTAYPSKVTTTTVSYPDSSTLLIPVDTDFATDTLTISGLSFTNFSARNGPVNALKLYLDGAGDGVSDATDDKTYTLNAVPAISLITPSPNPVGVGSDVTFSMDWTDSDSEGTKMFICKTDAIDGTPSCTGGNWCTNSASFTTTNPKTCLYTAQVGDTGTNNYYGFVCDDHVSCSSSRLGSFTVGSAYNRLKVDGNLKLEGNASF